MPGIARGQGIDIIITGHDCDEVVPVMGSSPNVFLNGFGMHTLIQQALSHEVPEGDDCVSHTPFIVMASPNVFVNGLGIARIGDRYTECGFVATGSPNVFANGV